MSKVIIMDGNSVGYASHHTPKLHSGEMQTQAIFHFVKTTRTLLRTYSQHQLITLWDKKASWRYKLHPGYKGDRENTPEKVAEKEQYHDQQPYILKALNALGVNQLSAEDHEADDLAGYLVNTLTAQGHEVLLISGDQDWIQLVNELCVWHDPIRDLTVNHRNFAEFTGYVSAQHFVEGKALQGDSSDTIPGVGGIGAKGAPDFIMQYGGCEQFLKLADEGKLPEKLPAAHRRFANNEVPPKSKKYGELPPVRDGFKRNMKLMDLRHVQKPSREQTNNVSGKYNEDRFMNLCGELAFHSILNNFDSWIEPFKERANG